VAVAVAVGTIILLQEELVGLAEVGLAEVDRVGLISMQV